MQLYTRNRRREKFTKTPLFLDFNFVQLQGHSPMLVPPESSSAVLVMISSESLSICNRSHARLVDSC